MACLEVWRGMRVESKGGKGSGYPFPLLGCFKN